MDGSDSNHSMPLGKGGVLVWEEMEYGVGRFFSIFSSSSITRDAPVYIELVGQPVLDSLLAMDLSGVCWLAPQWPGSGSRAHSGGRGKGDN